MRPSRTTRARATPPPHSRSCRGEPGCFWVLYFFPMQVASLEPDLRVDYTFDDYMALRDPMLERAQDETPPSSE